jgi:hypothetical protein
MRFPRMAFLFTEEMNQENRNAGKETIIFPALPAFLLS